MWSSNLILLTIAGISIGLALAGAAWLFFSWGLECLTNDDADDQAEYDRWSRKP